MGASAASTAKARGVAPRPGPSCLRDVSRRSIALLAGLVGLSALLVSSDAQAADQYPFELAKTRWANQEYEEACDRFRDMLEESLPPCSTTDEAKCRLTEPVFIENARAFFAACRHMDGDPAEVEKQIELVLRANLRFVPSADLPTEVLDLFEKKRLELEDELRDQAIQEQEDKIKKQKAENEAINAHLAYVRELEQSAGSETVHDDNSRLVAAIPFGVGQFQNGDVGLGVVFAASQLIAGGASIVTALLHTDLAADGVAAGSSGDSAELNSDLDNLALANRISFTVWALSTVVGIAEAQIFFEDGEVTQKKRPLPKRPPRPKGLEPKVGVSPEGGFVGVGGRF